MFSAATAATPQKVERYTRASRRESLEREGEQRIEVMEAAATLLDLSMASPKKIHVEDEASAESGLQLNILLL